MQVNPNLNMSNVWNVKRVQLSLLLEQDVTKYTTFETFHWSNLHILSH